MKKRFKEFKILSLLIISLQVHKYTPSYLSKAPMKLRRFCKSSPISQYQYQWCAACCVLCISPLCVTPSDNLTPVSQIMSLQ